MLKVGITGGLGSGKSTVTQLFGERGATIFDADMVAKLVLLRSPDIQNKLVAMFDDNVLNEMGELDFKRLADYAFSESGRQQDLNALIHPEVIAAIENEAVRAAARGVKLFVVDAPLLFEAGLESLLDITITVAADEELRVQRALARGNLTEEDIRRRIKLQLTDAERSVRADYVIINNGSQDELLQHAQEIYENLPIESF